MQEDTPKHMREKSYCISMHLANKTTISYIVKRIHKNYTPKNRQHNTIRTCHQYSLIFPLKLRKNNIS